ncbi:MAG: FkbM family methyltransferase [Acidimicrobiia bacterium]
MINLPLALAIRLEGVAARLAVPSWIWRRPTLYLRRVAGNTRTRAAILAITERRAHDTRTRTVVDCEVWASLREDPIEVLDVGARGGPIPAFRVFADVLRMTLVEPDPREARRLQRRWRSSCTVVETALGASDSYATLHVTRNPGGSSLLHPDDIGISSHLQRSRRSDLERFRVEEKVSVSVETLERLAIRLGTRFEVVKIDTQGSEGPIVSGFGDVRPLLVQVELTGDVPLYQGEWKAEDVVHHLSELGYLPIKRPLSHHGDWVFLRDPRKITERKHVERAIVAACILGALEPAVPVLATAHNGIPLLNSLAKLT